MTWLASGGCLGMTAHFTMTLEMSWFRRSRRLQAMTTLWCCLRRTDRRSQPTWTYHRASTLCPREFGRASTLFPIASSRKAHVVGLACTRICPRASSPSPKPSNEQNSLRNQKLFWSLRRRKFAQESLTTCPTNIDDSSAILEAGGACPKSSNSLATPKRTRGKA